MSRKYFGTDGMRGMVNKHPITADMALKFGMAAGQVFANGNHRHRVVIGKDTRISGYMIEYALVAGFTAVGMDVFLLGPMPTPAVAMLTRSLRADVGVMISASHNPYHDNGIKLFGPDGYKLDDEKEMLIESYMDDATNAKLVVPKHLGRARRINSAHARYIEFAKRTISNKVRFDGLKIVVDSANGAAYKVAPAALWELGAEIIEIGNSPNGFNINEGCGSTAPQLLQKTVLAHGADIGIALDGDADRIIVVNEKGDVVDGDQLMAAIAQHMKSKDALAKNGIVATVMSNLGLENFIKDNGMDFIRTDVGDRYVLEYMRKNGYNMGGEQSGHIILSDFNTTGDGLTAAIQIISIMVEKDMRASELCSRFEPVPQVLKNIRYDASGDDPLDKILVKAAIEDGRQRLKNSGRVLIRKSGTEPLIRVMAEGSDARLTEQVVDDIISSIG
ncbi:MAG: phosphoglucosamine mutase [Rhizobiales bacterium]|nr:phosphoglucosamine mutase [Hyphomicrobiales bacterium]NRB14151.1 phosphoglucosamine mutase [Hyphomicrobiales bacterium]